MSRVSLGENDATKLFTSKTHRDREAAVLNRLSRTTLAELIPRVTGISEEAGKYSLSMTRIAGIPLSEHVLNGEVVEQLASVLATCHQQFGFSSYGSLTSEFLVEGGQNRFGDFLAPQLLQWADRLMRFSAQYHGVTAALSGLIERHRLSLNRFVPAVFSHNDFDLKNVLYSQKKVVGLLDWEHVGAYPFAWDMRKLFPVLYWEKPDLGSQFQMRYLSQCLGAVVPSISEQALLVAVDCIGALSWAYRNRTQFEVNRISQLLNQALTMLSEGVRNE